MLDSYPKQCAIAEIHPPIFLYRAGFFTYICAAYQGWYITLFLLNDAECFYIRHFFLNYFSTSVLTFSHILNIF
jgi:hypothetical protein